MNVFKQTSNFRIVERAGRFYIECLQRNHVPKARRIAKKDLLYLEQCRDSFDSACVMDYGVGVFQKTKHPKMFTYNPLA
jgi:hypothetical protein